MRKLLLLIAFTLIYTGSAKAGNWFTEMKIAKQMALTNNKLIVVDFWASWCGPCKKMDREVWNEPEIQKQMNSYIPLKIDLDAKRNLAMKYNVKAIPYLFIMDANGEVVFQSKGFMDKQRTLEVLKTFALNTSFLQAESIQYFKNSNYSTALRLTQKYIDFSLFVNKEVRRDILNLSKVYLKASDKLLDKDQSNYNMVAQKIELMEANINLYESRLNRVERFLDRKIDEGELRKYNWKLYSFLNYCVAVRNKDKQLAAQWKDELNNTNGGDLYLTRADNFLNSN